MSSPHRLACGVLCAAVLLGAAGCDDDPSSPTLAPLSLEVLSDSVIGRQEAIRIVFNSDSIDQRTALDPENFIVIDRCTGLRIPGSVRLQRDTLVFSPSRAIPYLTPLGVRVQNVLDARGRAMEAPVTFELITEEPPVRDVSWTSLNTPTNDDVSGITFVDENLGFLSTFGGAIYRTTNGGRDFAALFKDPDIITTRVRAISADTIFMTGSPSFGGSTFTTAGLFRSVDGGRSFQVIFTANPASMRWPAIHEAAGRKPVVLIAGNQGSLTAWRYDTEIDSLAQFGPVGGQLGYGSRISPDGANAALVGAGITGPGLPRPAVAYRSTNGGRSFTAVPVPGESFNLFDVAFPSNTQAIAVGQRSGVYRIDVTSGAITRITNGVPQTDSTATELTIYNFYAITFAPGSQTGWIVGEVLRQEIGQPQVARGFILQTTDGGVTWTRQAVAGEREDGLGFEPLYDLTALAADFSSTGGRGGYLASRTAESSSGENLGVCAFREEPNALLQH